MNIAGSGSLPGGDYNEGIHISGSGKVTGNTSCTEFTISGAGRVNGDLRCSGQTKFSGSGTIEGNLETAELNVSGSGKVNGVTHSNRCHVSGSFHTASVSTNELHVSGMINSDGDVSAENAVIHGGIHAGGLINAEKLEIRFDGNSHADSIGGSSIQIHRKKITTGFFGRLFGMQHIDDFKVNGSIEGDVIDLDHTSAESVIGREVKIGPGCRIGSVSYIEKIDISNEAEIGSCTQQV